MFPRPHALRQSCCPPTWLLSGGLLLGVLLALSQAQVPTAIRPDGTLGTAVTQSGNIYNITGGTRPGNGRNLFHSFDRFSVGTNDTARFSGPSGIENILSRVTGGQQSVIDGRLQSTIPGANLYLLNPSGVLFGPNASLDVSGSFHVSTADFLRFADGATFSANLGQESVLTVAPPAAFGFLGNNPAAITIQGSSLQVSEGKALSVVGGDGQLAGGKLMAPSGRIQLASVASPGEVLFSRLDLGPELQVDSFTRLGRLELSQGGLLDVSGNGGGTVLLRSGRLLVDRSQIFANTLGDVAGASLGLDMRIAADAVIHDSDLRASPSAAGNGGNIVMNVGRLTLTDGGRILSSSRDAGRGGTLTVTAADAITITGHNSQGNQSGLFSNALSLGDAGRLFVSAPTLTMDDSSIQAGTGNGSRGNAGGAEVQVGRLTLTGGAQIDTSTRGSGRGGTLTVAATDAISITGRDQNGFPSALASDALSGEGNAGNLLLSTPRLTLDEGGVIAATAFDTSRGSGGNINIRVGRLTLSGGALIDSSTYGSGNAGDINVQVGQLTLSGGAQIGTSTRGSGRGGELRVVATEAISIAGRDTQDNQSGLFSNALSLGDAGHVAISAPTLTMDDGQIRAGTGEGSRGNAGGLEVRVGTLRMDGGRISANTLGDGNAGNVDVQVGKLTLMGGAQISNSNGATRFINGVPIFIGGQGRGGDLTVVATESISIAGQDSEGFRSGLFSNTNGSGDAGGLLVSTPLLSIDGGRIVTRTLGDGNAGDIEIRTGRLTLTGGAQIFSGIGDIEAGAVRGTQGPGRGGKVTVNATESIFIAGRDSEGFLSAIASNAQIGRGQAGNILISTPHLEMRDGFISTDTSNQSTGDAGSIDIRVGQLTLTKGAQILSSTSGSGRGGSVTVAATEQLDLSNGGTISASSSSKGDAGNIVIQAGKLFRSRNGAVTTEAEMADGGNITLTAGSLVELRDSQLTATVKSGVGKGGNITIDPPSVVLQRSQVRANAFGGPGGNVRIVGEVFLADPESRVSASSALGIAGTVDIQAPVSNLSGVVAPLPQRFVPEAALLRDRCAARLREGAVSSFVERGRDGVPANPEGVLPSRLYRGSAGVASPTSATAMSGLRVSRLDDNGHVRGRRRPALKGFALAREPECAAR